VLKVISKHWYVLHAYAGKERKVEKVLTLLQKRELQDVLLEIRYPAEEIVEVKGGKKRRGSKGFFPGYVLVQLALPKEGWQSIALKIIRIDGVIGFLGASKGVPPVPLSQEEVRSFLALTGESKAEAVNYHHFFTEGEVVRIIDGPFRTFTGTINMIQDDKSKMRVMVGILGRSTPVEVAFTQVEKI